MRIRYSALLFTLVFTGTCAAGEVRVAVASNFAPTLRTLAKGFETESGHTLSISPGSTGRHYAQIVNGAPFDLFLAADTERPEKLVKAGLATSENSFLYATGRLALYSFTPLPEENKENPAERLTNASRIAIANPRFSPYGQAAEQVIDNLKLTDALRNNLATGENISQTLQFVVSNNAQVGFVALSQMYVLHVDKQHFWPVPQELHNPIEQEGVILNETEATLAFVEFMGSDWAQHVMQIHGYNR